jgi:hypothetical protein
VRHPHRPRVRAGPEVADVLRDHAFGLDLTPQQAHAASAIVSCRSAKLGGHREVCKTCGFVRRAYNSCRNRHCPKCQILKQALWAERQRALALPTAYYQIVFTIPGELHPLFRVAPELCLKLLFQAVSETLLEVGKSHLRGEIGFTAVLHTWTQRLRFHPHIHCLVPAGVLRRLRWLSTGTRFFLPLGKLQPVFKGKLLEKLRRDVTAGKLPIPEREARALIQRAGEKQWGIRVESPLDGASHVVEYLSRYVHRIAISNSRILHYDGRTVVFRYKDRQDHNKTKPEKASGARFSQLFLQHVLPDRFVRIRHYGLLASRRRKDLERSRRMLGARGIPKPRKESWVAAFRRLFRRDPLRCPVCQKGRLVVLDVLPPLRL